RPSWSSSQAIHLRIVKAAGPAARRICLAEGLDGKGFLGGECGGHIAEGDSLPERVAVTRTRCRAHHGAVVDDGLAAMERREAVDGEGDELAFDALRLDAGEGGAADEFALVERDAEAEAGF